MYSTDFYDYDKLSKYPADFCSQHSTESFKKQSQTVHISFHHVCLLQKRCCISKLCLINICPLYTRSIFTKVLSSYSVEKKNPERAGNLHTMPWRAVLNFLTRGNFYNRWYTVRRGRTGCSSSRIYLLTNPCREAVLLSSFLSQPAYSRVAVNAFRVIANQWFYLLCFFIWH